MYCFKINGGKQLKGEIEVQGAKNEALQVISAVVLCKYPVIIHNIPDILDVHNLIDLLKELGVAVKRINKNSYVFNAEYLQIENIESEIFLRKGSSLRGSVMLTGAMLGRFQKAILPKPGGDKIGRRKLDTHLLGFQKLGVKFNYDIKQEYYELNSQSAESTYILMEEPSVTGTANLIFASVTLKGITTLYNAACEPYIQQLCKMLNNMGAKINGIGSNLLTIEGVEELSGTEHTVLPDMIEVGSFIGMAAMTQSKLTIKNAGVKHLGIMLERFAQMGIHLKIKQDDIIVSQQNLYTIPDSIDGAIPTFYDNPWPGLSPDLLSIFLVVAIQAKGELLIHQKMFESRLFFIDKLIDMGAKIIMCDPHRATVIGLARRIKLKGITMSSPDIRAGVALLIAALSAEGTSTILNIEQIDRGYQDIEHRLLKIGANISRERIL